jgi:hypothetical protein
LAEDPKWELAILATVQGFYEKLLQQPVGGEVPVPAGLEAVSLQSDNDVQETLNSMHRWLRLLDMAITPAMLRRAFTSDTDPEIAEAMLRYYTRSRDNTDIHRDKTDLVATFLYRHPRVPGQWEQRGVGLDGSLPLSPFEIALLEILADSEVPSLPEDHMQILRRFDPLLEQAGKCRDLNALLESGIIATVRDFKQSLEASFYHPGVLATLAPYNAEFGKIFDSQFMAATTEIKNFAEALEEQGGSILGNVDGVDVTVDHVAAMRESDLLKVDYGQALDKFKRVSKLKQALERRPPIRRKPQLVPSGPAKAAPRAAAKAARPTLDVERMRAGVTPQQISAEGTKLRKVEESIRIFVRVADPKFRQIVPMRFFNLTLSASEVEAYCADYVDEKSLRAGVARILLRLVAVTARLHTELEESKHAANSPSLWRLHADALVVLLEVARSLEQNAERMVMLAKQHNSPDGAKAIQGSLRKMQDCSEVVLRELSGAPAEKAVSAGAD